MTQYLRKIFYLILLIALVLPMAFFNFPFNRSDLIEVEQAEASSWWMSSWVYRQELTIDNTKIDSNLADFPVLVKLTSSNLDFSKVKTDGADIRFIASDDSTQLKYEIEEWNDTAEEAYIWVKIPSVSSSEDARFYMYYGNISATDNQDPENVWDDNYIGVWHLSETGTGTRYDSTRNNADAIAVNYDGDEAVDGQIGGGDDLDGLDDYLEVDGNSIFNFGTGDFTYSSIFKADQTLDNAVIIRGNWDVEDRAAGMYLSSNEIITHSRDSSLIFKYTSNAFSDTTDFHQVDFVRNSATLIGYLDSAGMTTNNTAGADINLDSNNLHRIGQSSRADPSHTPERFDGIIDEVRISNVARSDAWLNASYYSAQDDLISYGELELSPSTWWDNSWGYRKQVIIDSSKIDSTLTDFPALVKLDSTNFDFTKADSSGADVRFVNFSQDTEFKYEIEGWDDTAEEAYIWVKISEISSTSDTIFYMYYGNDSAVDNQDPENVWDDNYVAVWHLNEDSTGTRYDSTTNDNDGTPNNYDNDESVSGQIGGADDFDGIDDYIEISGDSSFDFGAGDFTYSVYFNADNVIDTGDIIRGAWSANDRAVGILLSSSTIYAHARNSSGSWLECTNSFSDTDNYHSAVLVRNSSTIYGYLDGLDMTSTGASGADISLTSNARHRIAQNSRSSADDSPERFDGIIDEVRISNVARSEDWVKAEYYTQNNTLLSVGNEQEGSATVSTKPLNISPEDGADMPSKNPTLIASVYTGSGTHQASQWQVSTTTGEDFDTGLVWDSGIDVVNLTSIIVNDTNGTFQGALSGETELRNDTTYYWKVAYRNDSSEWTSFSVDTSFGPPRPVSVIAVGATEYESGETASLIVQLKDVDGDPISSSATLTLDIYSPSRSLLVDDGSMSYITGSEGLYYYDYTTPETEGVYLYSVSSTYSGQNSYTAHTFHVAPWANSIGDLPESVWTYTGRSLDSVSTIVSGVWDASRDSYDTAGSFGEALQTIVPSVADMTNGIWGADRSSYSSADTFGEALQNIVPTAGEIATAVWSYTSDVGATLATNLGSFPWSYTGSDLDTASNAIAKVWSYATRNLTSGVSIADDIWNATTRKLTSRQIGSETEYIAGVDSSSTVNQVADDVTQTDIEYDVELVRKGTFDFAGFADSGSSTTLIVDSELTEYPDDHWNNYGITVISGDNAGEAGVVCDFTSSTGTITLCSAMDNPIALSDKYVITHERKLVYSIWNWSDRQLTSLAGVASDIWGYSGGRTLSSLGSLAADVWNDTYAPTRRLSDDTLSDGGSLASDSDLATAKSDIITEIDANETKIDSLQVDVTAMSVNVDLIYTDTQAIDTNVDSIVTNWDTYSASDIIGYIDEIESRLGTSSDLSTDETIFGRTKYVQEKWGTTTGENIYNAVDNVSTALDSVRTEIGYEGVGDSAYDDIQDLVAYVDNLETYLGTPSDTSADETLFGKVALVNDNLDQLDTIESKVDIIDGLIDSVKLTVEDTNTDLETIDTNVDSLIANWSTYSADDIIGYIDEIETRLGTSADLSSDETLFGRTKYLQEKWGSQTATTIYNKINEVSTAQQDDYSFELAGTDELAIGDTYRAKLSIANYQEVPTDASALPTVTLYDAERAEEVSSVAMTKLSDGLYEYTYAVPGASADGVWEAEVSVTTDGANYVTLNDYFKVNASPTQVIINSVSDTEIPTITANVTITNEGSAGYEYPYEYCIVDSIGNDCGGGDDLAYASAARYLDADESWTTDLSLDIDTTGDYYFKLITHWGSETSEARASFTASDDGDDEEEEEGDDGRRRLPDDDTEDIIIVDDEEDEDEEDSLSLSSDEEVTLDLLYQSIVDLREELGYSGKSSSAYTNLLSAQAQINQLNQNFEQNILAIADQLNNLNQDLGLVSGSQGYTFDELYRVASTDSTDIKYLKNQTLELKALLDVNKQLMDKMINEPVIKTWLEWGSVIIKMSITNPSDSQAQTLPFKSYLPYEVKPEHIMDQQDFNLDYDATEDLWYVHQDIELKPGETVTKQVHIKDIWVIDQEEIDAYRREVLELTKPLEGTPYFAQATTLKSEIERLLDIIERKQKEYKATPKEHISVYRENVDNLNSVKKNIEALRLIITEQSEATKAQGNLFGVSTTMTWAIVLVVVVGIGLLMIILAIILKKNK